MNTPASTPLTDPVASQLRRPSRAGVLYCIAVLLLISGICAILLASRALDQTGDSLSYASSARAGTSLYHPHHLLFNGAVRVTYLVLGGLSGHWNVLLAGQLHNLAFLALALAAMARIGRRTLSSPAVSLLAVLLCGSLNGVMVFATQIEVYVPAVACLVAAAAALFDGRLGRSRMVLVAGFWALGVLYHQTGVLFAVPLLAFLFAQRRRDATRFAAGIVVLAGSAVLTVYIAAFLSMGYNDGTSFLDFCLWYVDNGRESWGTASNLQLTGLSNLAQSQWWALTSLPSGGVSVFLLGSVLGGLLILALVLPKRYYRHRNLLRFSLIWYLTYGLFFWWWLPTEVEFCILMSLPLCLALLATIALVSEVILLPNVILGTAFLIALCGFSVHLRGEVLPRHRNPGASYEIAAGFHDIDNGKCLALIRHRAMTTYWFYFVDDRSRSLETSRGFQQVVSGEGDKLQERRKHCLVASAKDVIPKASFQGLTGFTAPERWLRFVLWLVDARPHGDRPSDDNTGFHTREFQWILHDSGQTFLFVGENERQWQDIDEFLTQFAALARPHYPWLSQQLEKWHALHSSKLKEWW